MTPVMIVALAAPLRTHRRKKMVEKATGALWSFLDGLSTSRQAQTGWLQSTT
jgi:hypothetical protein